MDSNDLERERGITILAKNCAVMWEGTHINIVDTPGTPISAAGRARASMVDGRAAAGRCGTRGRMPQTRFVTRKCAGAGAETIVVVTDRPAGARRTGGEPHVRPVDKLGATEAQLDFPIVYASALEGWPTTDLGQKSDSLRRCSRRSCEHVPGARDNPDAPLQRNCSLRLLELRGPHRHRPLIRGRIRSGQQVTVLHGPEGAPSPHQCQGQPGPGVQGLERVVVDEAQAGDIVLVNGIDEIGIGVTITDPEHPEALPLAQGRRADAHDETSRSTPRARRARGQIRDQPPVRELCSARLMSNVPLRVQETADADIFRGLRPRASCTSRSVENAGAGL